MARDWAHCLIGTAPQHYVGPATGSGVPLALHGSCVGRASHLCSLYTTEAAVNPTLLDHAVYICSEADKACHTGRAWTPDTLWASTVR